MILFFLIFEIYSHEKDATKSTEPLTFLVVVYWTFESAIFAQLVIERSRVRVSPTALSSTALGSCF